MVRNWNTDRVQAMLSVLIGQFNWKVDFMPKKLWKVHDRRSTCATIAQLRFKMSSSITRVIKLGNELAFQ